MDKLLDGSFVLSSYGEWLLTQLEIARYWGGGQRGSEDSKDLAPDHDGISLPNRWEMTREIQLWDWQRKCAETWLNQGRRGIAKVVTGAGKTVFAQHLIERLQTEFDSELRVAIVVPTIVLMRQWVDSLTTHSNLPRHSIGCLGGGFDDRFNNITRILVCVLNSASAHLSERVREALVGDHLLLVVDECHRATGRSMSKVFGTTRQYNLGLSATPERENIEDSVDENDTATFPDQLETSITNELGLVIYELDVAEAVRLGILSTFEIKHYGLPLEPNERMSYEKISRDIRELTKTLKGATVRAGSSKSLFRLAQHFAGKPGSTFFGDASEYLMDIRRRKNLLYLARSRTYAVLEIVSSTLDQSPDSKILLFHESINEVMRLYLALLRSGYRVTVDHSKLPDSLRAESISLFRSGGANILVSARTLIEGFDVPSADVGIIAASSTSPRQRIQTIGRVLRRPKGETDKRAIIHTLYMAGTVDEAIYDKTDWGKVTGAEQNFYFLWSPPPLDTPPGERSSQGFVPGKQPGPPRQPRPTELEVDWDGLKTGEVYPGKFEGVEYHCDHQGNVLDLTGRMVSNPQGIPDLVFATCEDSFRFKVTPVKRAILCWDRRSQSVRFVGFLGKPFRATSKSPVRAGRQKGIEHDLPLQFRIKQFRGQRRIQDYAGRFALIPGQAEDQEKGQDAEKVIQAINELEKRLGKPVYQFLIEGDEAYCVLDGQRYTLYRLKKGLEFR